MTQSASKPVSVTTGLPRRVGVTTITCVEAVASQLTAQQRREALKRVFAETQVCRRCPELAATRKHVVFGAGNANADLMFVGEAPGANEDDQGIPFVGQAGKLLDKLLAEIGLSKGDVFIANTLKCRPPGNRDPLPIEIENCQGFLYSQVELVQPKVICTLGNFATKLLRKDKTGITRLHGHAELLTLGRRTVRLYPIFHPAAALYTPRMLQTLREDFERLPELLAMPAPEQPPAIEEPPAMEAGVLEEASADGADTGEGPLRTGVPGTPLSAAPNSAAGGSSRSAGPGTEEGSAAGADQLGLF